MALFDRIQKSLTKTREALDRGFEPLRAAVDRLDPAGRRWDESLLTRLEEALLAADVGVETAEALVAELRRRRVPADGDGRPVLVAAVTEFLLGGGRTAPGTFQAPPGVRPWVVLVVGVNGSGKTTLIGKLAAREHRAGRSVVLVAADTFRAAATEQLAVWAERAGAELVQQRPGADPAAVAHDGVSAAVARGADTVFIDTAGRLHTQGNLMEEIAKVRRVVAKVRPGAPHEILLVLDGTAGQNALQQARQFHAVLGVTGLVVNKLDDTARGGAVLAATRELGVPVRLLGLGEAVEDVEEFDAAAYAAALLGAAAPATSASGP